MMCLLFFSGGKFIEIGRLNFLEMFTAMMSLFFAGMGIGIAATQLPDMGKAKVAAINIFKILDTESEIDYMNSGSIKEKLTGNIEFKNVSFKYPTRRKKVLNQVSFKVERAEKIALVGASGSGKSTCIQLLMRNYNPIDGEILIDGRNIKDYDLHFLRRSFGVVSQEPFMFIGTIEDNIKYCKPDATLEEMRAAATKANAINFIEKDEFEMVIKNDPAQDKTKKRKLTKKEMEMIEKGKGKGFQKFVGLKGTQISGGQVNSHFYRQG
jgi:ATP-binding cassette subfamily B (MDR/TAP) protein 1